MNKSDAGTRPEAVTMAASTRMQYSDTPHLNVTDGMDNVTNVVTTMMTDAVTKAEKLSDLVTIDVTELAGDFKVVLPCVFGALLILALTMVVFYHNVGEIEEIILEKEEEEEKNEKGGNRASWYDNRGYITSNTGKTINNSNSIYTYG